MLFCRWTSQPLEAKEAIRRCFLTTMAWTIIFLIWVSYSQGLKIDLSNQGLEVVPKNLNINVSSLILDSNILITVNSTSFDIYVYLKEVTLMNCQTAYIKDGTFDNHDKLVIIRLDRCKILQLPQSFGPSTSNIKTFSIYGEYDSNSIFKPPYFFAFLRLDTLNLGGRYFQSFNSSILPSNIKFFKLDFVNLASFPDFRNQQSLLSLSVMGNSISEIPEQHIVSLSELISLRLERDKIKSFPNISHMKKLKTLKIGNNEIPLFPREYVSELDSLETFIGSHNLVQIMPNISYLSKLKIADFSNNIIQYVPASCLNDIPMIQSLYLNGNRIISMEDNSMASGNLYLHDNHLASPPNLYGMIISSLTLQGNPLVCDQLLCWLRMWPFNKTLPQLDEFRCTSPPSLNGTLVMDVHPTKLGCYRGKFWELYMIVSTSVSYVCLYITSNL